MVGVSEVSHTDLESKIEILDNLLQAEGLSRTDTSLILLMATSVFQDDIPWLHVAGLEARRAWISGSDTDIKYTTRTVIYVADASLRQFE